MDGVVEQAKDGWLTRQQAQLARLLQALAAHISKSDPAAVDTMLRGVANSLPRLSPRSSLAC